MTPLEEAIDLKENPLPVQVTHADILLPTALHEMDRAIEQTKLQLKEMQDERDRLVARILETQVFEDQFCRVERKDRTNRKLVPDIFKQQYPEAYQRARDVVTSDLERQLANPDGLIGVTLAEKMVGKSGKDQFHICCVTTVTTSYTAVEKE